MDVQLFRVDDRLIHGQVVIGWAGPLKTRRIILCDDEIYANDWERELFCSCVPASLETKIFDIRHTTDFLVNSIAEKDRTIVLVKDPTAVINIVNSGYKPGKINLGGMHHIDGRKKYLSYLYMTEKEMTELEWLSEQGILIYCQDVPTGRRYEWADVIKDSKRSS
ncbi:MAG: PTS mannose/fructose/sorbose transporter subunit IIB [Calditrichales bacterium]|nr:MAG: PTS mannose/fructose/sorbose transporter subunit IIB [Calditrichales bacterium]